MANIQVPLLTVSHFTIAGKIFPSLYTGQMPQWACMDCKQVTHKPRDEESKGPGIGELIWEHARGREWWERQGKNGPGKEVTGTQSRVGVGWHIGVGLCLPGTADLFPRWSRSPSHQRQGFTGHPIVTAARAPLLPYKAPAPCGLSRAGHVCLKPLAKWNKPTSTR